MREFLTDLPASGRLFALIGDPVAHSKSPAFWNEAFKSLSINALYVPCRAEAFELQECITFLTAHRAEGFNVTMPHKIAAAGLCSHLCAPADVLNAVNCVKINPDGSLEGHNTDATGIYRVFSRLCCHLPSRKALVMGNGGAAAAVIWALQQLHFDIIQIARKFSDVTFADTRLLEWNRKNFAHGIAESDIIVNATTLGWDNKDSVQELKDFLNCGKIFVDLNYAPYSDLVASALKKGCLVIDGRELLFEQGIESFKILVGTEPPKSVIRQSIFS